MATYVHRIHLNRPINTRLIIAVRFVVTAADARISSGPDTMQYTQKSTTRSNALSRITAPGEQSYRTTSREAATVGVRGTVAMRLRVAGHQAIPAMKEYHHAESLPA
ncbi:hypothetical protein KDW_11220 [Dictyobacter vulcani]|uniref:Uncharacterized protein n=1 Tax=Dictyobacter vulcani TaxID=2607529 RepID=A0A5J4KKN2_9CHLR|nr:hypothetical protein [Dictyobacter vulcani]GER86960.1 hypothetical protein KDW_11220 [Dictyobacter vulcani]